MPLLIHSSPAAPAPRLARRDLLRAGLLGGAGALLLPACGPVELGQPATYTPPPPGVDDLYRLDLLSQLERVIAGADALAEAGDGRDPARAAIVTTLTQTLPVQRRALLTGAELEKEIEAQEDPEPGQTPPAPPADVPADAAEQRAALLALRKLCTQAARQVSGSLARPISAIGAHIAWATVRLSSAFELEKVPAPPAAEDIVPVREVPATDPPSIGAASDLQDSLASAQEAEWRAGYLREALAARSEGRERSAQEKLVEVHRGRAAGLGEIAEAAGAPVISRRAVYPVPGGVLDEQLAGRLPMLLTQELLIEHLAVVGAAPFEDRPLSLSAALTEAHRLAAWRDDLTALPGIEVEPPPSL